MRTPIHRTTSQPRGGPARSTALLVTLLAMTLGLAGCSGDDEPDGGDRRPGGGASTTATVTTDAKLGRVHGELPRKRSKKVLADVTAVVDGWFAGGFAGDYPREKFGSAFSDFTKGARRQARRERGVMSNDKVGAQVQGVEVGKQVVRVDIAAPNGRLAGATARFRLKIKLTGGVERTDLVSGRLLLTPTKRGWKVFGFDVRRGKAAG